MATYKMIQDIEAEDHIIGPLSLRQFIFALISAFLLYINFLCFTKHVAFLMIVFLPPALFTGFFAFPFGGDQPTEIWALAKIRFLFKPRQRIWDQSGVKELVTITVPKKIERNLTNGLSQTEVQSRLSALANTIDSRGWAVKNVNVNLYANPGSIEEASDRLININNLPREVPNYDVHASDDILDEHSNPIAQQFEQMIEASSQTHHQDLINQMNASTPASTAVTAAPVTDNWFMSQPAAAAVAIPAPAPTAQPSIDEAAFLAKVHADEANALVSNAHLHTLQPLTDQATSRTPAAAAAPVPQPISVPSTASPAAADPAILSLAGNNDLNIATLAREAEKSKHAGSLDSANGEVVISLR